MIQKLNFSKLLIVAAISLMLVLTGMSVSRVYADDISDNLDCGTSFNLDSKNCKTDAAKAKQDKIDAINSNSKLSAAEKKQKIAAVNNPSSGLESLINTVVNVLTIIVGIVGVIMIIVGGFKYITSGGDSNKVGSAKSTIIYALVGLIIAALAQVIAKFVLSAAT